MKKQVKIDKLSENIRSGKSLKEFNDLLLPIKSDLSISLIKALVDLAVDHNQREKYDLLKSYAVESGISLKQFFQQTPGIYSFYDRDFESEFKEVLKYKDNKFDHLRVFVTNHIKTINSVFIDLIYERLSREEKIKLTGEALGRSILLNETNNIHYFFDKSVKDKFVKEMDIELETSLKNNVSLSLRSNPKFNSCEELDKLFEKLEEISEYYLGVNNYKSILKKYELYRELDESLNQTKAVINKNKI